MDEHSLKFSKNVPHLIPGYTGYCPQLKFHIGKSYGKLTSKLLKEMHSSRLQVLSAETSTSIPGNDPSRIIPGYTGFIPRREEYIGCTYSTMCQKALTEFHQETQERIRRRSVHLPLAGSQHIDANFASSSYSQTLRLHASLSDIVQRHVPKSHFLFGNDYPAITNKALTDFEQQSLEEPTAPRQGEQYDTYPAHCLT